MRCYEVFHVRASHTGPLPGLTWRSMSDLGSSPDLLDTGLERRIGAVR